MEIKFREARQDDIAFITSTWMRALWNSKCYKDIKKSIFMQGHHGSIQSRMKNLMCLIACNPDDPYVIYGYIVYSEPNIVHFAYVKGNFRGFGIFKKLIKGSIGEQENYISTHKTDYLKELETKFNISYNPYEFYDVAR